MEVELVLKICVSIGLIGVLGLVLRIYNALVKKPAKLRWVLEKQGVGGPPQRVLLGNILEIKRSRNATAKPPTCGAPADHNCSNALFSFFENWQKQYGKLIIVTCNCNRELLFY